MEKSVLKTGLAGVASVIVATMLMGSPAQAALVNVAGGGTILGGAPVDVSDNAAMNDHQQGFDEKQGVTVGALGLAVNGGTIAAGTQVNSHMIFLNTKGTKPATHLGVDWTFDGVILGVMTDIHGTLEGLSNTLLGAVGTFYPGGFNNRGLEGTAGGANGNGGGDMYSFLAGGNVLTVGMHVTEPGDWIRVVTAVSAVPLPAALPLYGAGIAVLGFMGWRRRKNVA